MVFTVERKSATGPTWVKYGLDGVPDGSALILGPIWDAQENRHGLREGRDPWGTRHCYTYWHTCSSNRPHWDFYGLHLSVKKIGAQKPAHC